ncbi:hypothetical protein [Escherichia coli]|nr:hypothetical protein [Escherichia coli]MCV8379709.1 hypothetical protein [Escherichia coli]
MKLASRFGRINQIRRDRPLTIDVSYPDWRTLLLSHGVRKS